MWPFKSKKQQLEEGRKKIAAAKKRAEQSINTPAVIEMKRQAAENWERHRVRLLEAKEKLMACYVRDGLSPEQIAKAEATLDQIGGINEKNPWLETRE